MLKNIIGLFFITLWLLGCSSGMQMDTQKVESIKNGVTTEAEIRATFGEPVSTSYNKKRHRKTLYYQYGNTDGLKKFAGTVGAAALGGLVGSQFGGGTGSAWLAAGGATAAGAVANNMITTRQEKQELTIIIDSRTGIVVDHNFTENKARTQKKHFNSGVSPL